MANKVTIDVEARFVDNVTDEAKAAAKSFKEVEKAAEAAQSEMADMGKQKVKPKVDVDNTSATKKLSDTGKKMAEIGKQKVNPKLDADNSSLAKKLDDTDKKLSKLGRTRTDVKLGAMDKATNVLKKVLDKAKSFGGKTYSALVKVRDSNALSTLNKISNTGRNIAGKTWQAAVKIKDMATAPLRGIKNMLFSVKSLVMAITAGLAAKQFVINPINLADAYTSAKIGFSTLLGESQGQQMMNDLDAFAKATPFKSSEVIGQTQRMLAMGWNAEDIIKDMETIGDAAAATGKGEMGLQQIVTALSQIKTKGKLSTEELNQLAEAGISAKRYIAEGLGYGTGDSGIAAMTKDLEKGAITSDKALQALLSGMKEYQGMMEQTANETVEGLWSQIEDTFEINIMRRWGQGLQDGAKDAFGSVVTLLEEADGALTEFGDTIYEVGKSISTWVADKFEKAVQRVTEITDSFEFKNASLKEKISMLWNGVIADPLKEWWEGGGQEKTAETAGKIGSWMGEMLTKGLLALFGATDVLDEGIGSNAGSSIAGSFLQGFMDNFDGQAITDAFVDAINNVWGALPTWAKILIGGYAVGKTAGGIANFAGGITSFIGGVKNLIGTSAVLNEAGDVVGATGLIGAIGSTGNAMVSGTGILGKLASAGYALTGGPASAGAYFGAGMSGSTAALIGGAGIAGGLMAGASVIKGGHDLYSSYKAYKAGDKREAKASAVSGGTTLAGVGTGAAIGSIFGPLGTLVGAGIGGLVGWVGGNMMADKIREAKYESEEMKDAIKDSEMSAEELAQTLEKAKWENAREHFGDIKLSLTEIERLVDQIVWGSDMVNYEKFTSATQASEAALKSLKAASEQTDRWMWKASMGVAFNDDEKESFIASFDEYINAAKSFVENKHYEFTAAVSLLVDTESEGGKAIIESGNAFYGKMQEQLNSLGAELSGKVNIALEDGVITLDENKEIINLQQQIAAITEKVANAEQKAELSLIKAKFGGGNLDYESFETFMAQMQTTIDERMAANDKAYKATVASLELELAEGSISQEQYDEQLQTILDGYNNSAATLRAEIKNVELEIIGEAYSDTLGADAAADLNKVLEHAINEGIDPIEISDEKMAELLNINLEGNGETIANLRDWLSNIAMQLDLIADEELPDSIQKTVGVDITGEKNIQNTIDVLVSDFGVPEEQADTVALLLTGDKEILSMIDTTALAAELGVPESVAEDIITKLSGTKSIEERVNVLGSDLVDATEVWQTITVNLKAKVGQVIDKVSGFFGGGSKESGKGSGKGSGYRGGIFGGPSAMESFYRGGIVGGSTRFVRVNEESPEMIIPLSSQRRGRALKLWAQAGNIMGVPGFARGGLTSGGVDEGIRFHQYGSDEAPGGQIVQIEVGGITVEIHVDARGTDNISEAIEKQKEEIAEVIAGIMADAFSGQFQNTPVRGGGAA